MPALSFWFKPEQNPVLTSQPRAVLGAENKNRAPDSPGGFKIQIQCPPYVSRNKACKGLQIPVIPGFKGTIISHPDFLLQDYRGESRTHQAQIGEKPCDSPVSIYKWVYPDKKMM
jgi:hypothetical protein